MCPGGLRAERDGRVVADRKDVMKVLVIGASGNIGQNVVRGLLGLGADVVAFVRDATGEVPPTSPLAQPEVQLASGDLLQPDTVRKAATGCDSVFIVTPHAPNQVTMQNAAV